MRVIQAMTSHLRNESELSPALSGHKQSQVVPLQKA